MAPEVKYTNRHHWPQVICDVVTKDRYSNSDEAPSDYSATTLINPVQKTILEKRFPDKLKTFDVSDSFWAFMGQVCHSVLEEAWTAEEGSKCEERLYAEVEGKTLSGKIDCFANGELRDFKTTKCYKIIRGEYSSWSEQLNIYTYLLRKNGVQVNSARIIAILFDWSKQQKLRTTNYPDSQIVEIPIPLWSFEDQERFIVSKIQALKRAELLTPEELAVWYPCSDKDCWSDTKDFAVMKPGAQRATKCFDNAADAQRYCPAGSVVVERKTERTRCLDHCAAAPLCHQFKTYWEEKHGERDGE